MKRIIFFLGLLLSYPALSSGQANILVVDDAFERTRITGEAFKLPAGKKADHLDSILLVEADDWIPVSKNGFAKPYTKQAWWIRFHFRSTEPRTLIFENQYPMLDEYSIYLHQESTGEISFLGNLGMNRDLPDSLNQTKLPTVAFQTDKNQQYTLYLYLDKRFGTSFLPFYLWDAESYRADLADRRFNEGFIYGVFSLLFLAGLFLGLYLKQRIYFLYSIYLLNLCGVLLISDGSFRILLNGKNLQAAYFTLYYFLLISYFLLFLILSEILHTKTLLPAWHRMVRMLIGFGAITLVFITIAYFYIPIVPLIVFKLSLILLTIVPIVLTIINIKTFLLTKNSEALLFLLLFSVALIFALTFSLLPYLKFDFEKFLFFQWLFLFEGIMLLIIISRGLYLLALRSFELEKALLLSKEEASKVYLEGLSDERKRIAQELHDGIGLKLLSLKMKLSKDVFSSEDLKRNRLSEIDQIHADIRASSQAISPILLREKGLIAAMEEIILSLEDAYPEMIFDFEWSDKLELPNQQIEEYFYWTFMELMNNSLKHAQAKTITIVLKPFDSHWVLCLSDDGIAYSLDENAKEMQGGSGLKTIRRRAKILNGLFQVERPKAGGIKQCFMIPFQSKQSE